MRTLLDAPCGDFHWMRTVDLGIEDYIGVGILDEVIAAHQWRHAGRGRLFLRLDLIQDELPRADAILCRDLLPHLTYAEVWAVLRNFRSTVAECLMTTTFTGPRTNHETATRGIGAIPTCRPHRSTFLRRCSCPTRNAPRPVAHLPTSVSPCGISTSCPCTSRLSEPTPLLDR
ncbi:hypothetical protein [Roseateles puraquae]|uniref:hypothetical protein n=1 Tax=Roseateles puraquae TaxID=431059 RepID=UPI001186F76D|nr:hypothetical protein [Roseateles puraquae]